MNYSERLKTARKQKKLTQNQLSEKAGVDQSIISKLERGVHAGSAHTVSLARALGVNAEWLSDGIGDMLTGSSNPPPIQAEAEFIGGFDAWDSDTPLGEDEVEIPLFREVELAAGEGRTQVVESQGCKLRFAKSTFRKAGILPNNAACCFVSGDSMEPAMPDGTTVGVDTQDVTVRDGKTYVIDHDGMLRVKMLYRLPGGGIRVRSMNPNKVEFPDEDYHAGWQHYIKIKGRVFWSSTMW